MAGGCPRHGPAWVPEAADKWKDQGHGGVPENAAPWPNNSSKPNFDGRAKRVTFADDDDITDATDTEGRRGKEGAAEGIQVGASMGEGDGAGE